MSQPVLNGAMVQGQHQGCRYRLMPPSCCISNVPKLWRKGKSTLCSCLGLRGASFLLLLFSAGCHWLQSLKTSHRFKTFGEILLKSRYGIEPSSHLPRPIIGSVERWRCSFWFGFHSPFPFLEDFRARVHVYESVWMFPVTGTPRYMSSLPIVSKRSTRNTEKPRPCVNLNF